MEAEALFQILAFLQQMKEDEVASIDYSEVLNEIFQQLALLNMTLSNIYVILNTMFVISFFVIAIVLARWFFKSLYKNLLFKNI